MIHLGDAPTDMLFGLMALHNDLVAPAVIPGALEAQALEPGRTLADILVTQGAMTVTQRDLVESLSGEFLQRHGGDVQKSVETLVDAPSVRKRLDGLSGLISGASGNSTLPFETASRSNDPESTLLPLAGAPIAPLMELPGYELIEVLGIGGMGIVYKAYQRRLERDVAVKMIRAGAGARPEDLLRFEEEAKAVAAINHTNIVKIFEISEQNGLPFFSLEYLSGGSLAKKIGGKPQPMDEAARTVETLARAIHVAHQHKVIHRDLKPANVLLADDGTLKITDFGLVKRLESDSGHTRSGSILGTPSYMAPEQARGEGQVVGAAADQYALGAILYELLTGRPPFQGTSVLETLDLVRNREPVPPSQLQPKTPRDLETICLKCLEKDIGRRYDDALAVAEDLRRFRAGEPILARPVSNLERAWRWCLRNKRVASLSAAVVLLLVIVTAGSAIAALTLGQKNRELVTAKTVADEKRKEAEEKEARAVKAARAANVQNRNAVDADVGLARLLDGKLRDVPAIENERKKMLDDAIGRLISTARAMADLRRDIEWDPEDEAHNWRSLARAHQALARLNLSRNKIDDAMEQFRQTEQIIAVLTAAAPADLDLQVNLLRTQREMGNVSMYRVGDSEAARRCFSRAVEISRALLAKKPDNDVYKSELANSLGQVAGAELRLGHLDQARELYQEEVTVRDSFSPALKADWESRRERTSLHVQLAELNVRLGDRLEGRRLYEQCANQREQLANERPNSWPAQNDLGNSYNSLGALLYPVGGDAAGARKFFQKALAIFKRRADADPSDFDNKHVLAQTYNYDATCALHSGDKDGAARGFRECLKISEELAKEPKAKIPQTELMLALARCGDHVNAARIAGELVAKPPLDESIYFFAACGYALASSAATGNTELVRHYVREAVECLRKAKKRGWADIQSLEIDTDLEPIRNDPDFKALVDEFRKTPGK